MPFIHHRLRNPNRQQPIGPSRKSGNTASAAADAYRPEVDSPIAQSQVLPSRTAHSAMGGIAAAADFRSSDLGISFI
ncbi:hypothetical protein HYU20_01885 [Candidatus Woesearchaeota archaeon]|nr:hypothetical protein [Candidatus Woesearchaeota archaeon]